MDTSIEKRPEGDLMKTERTRGGPAFVPYADIYETDEELVIELDVPGVAEDGLDVRFENGVLTLAGKVQARDRDGNRHLLREYQVGDFHRAFQMGEAIDVERISAEYTDGVAVLRVPKAEGAKPRRIEVKSA